ncbi:MAG: putative oxidoreductase [Candidatus Azotimanducaceae bacterium]
MQLLSKYSDSIYAVMRMVSGAMFALHGAQKIFGWWAQNETAVGSQIWFGGVIELVGGLLIAVGFQTRIAAFIASGTMAVAYFQFHWGFELSSKILPLVNHGDGAVLYSFLFLYIASKGAVQWSIDRD